MMTDLFIYLLKVSAAIALVALPYYLVIRFDASLFLKRIYLAGGILLSWTFPLLTIRKPSIVAAELPVFYIDPATVSGTAIPENIPTGASLNVGLILAILYLTGILLFLMLNLLSYLKIRRSTIAASTANGKVLTTSSNKVFTIFNTIFLPVKYRAKEEIDTILIHEQAHIRQLHFIDLLISELSLLLTWFNPFSWLISRMIKENHEHLADREVLSQGVKPAHYKALLLNHALGGEVFRLGHQFNHSLTKKRFNMMKKMKATKRGIVKYMFFVPTILFFTLMITAAGQNERTIHGKVFLKSADVPAHGASVIVQGTTTGTVADKQGEFTLELSGNPAIVFSYVGYETVRVDANKLKSKPVILIPTAAEIPLERINQSMTASETEKAVSTKSAGTKGPGTQKEIGSQKEADKQKDAGSQKEVDSQKEAGSQKAMGKQKDMGIQKEIGKQNEVSSQRDTDKQQETIRQNETEEVFFVVEEIPSFPGGLTALGKYLHENLKYPSEEIFFSAKEKVAGLAKVEFIVQADGSIDHVRIVESSNDIFNQAALDVIKNMPKWKPGSQRGKEVPCKVIVPVEFKLPQE